jgi:hypothetical protein
MACEKFGLLLSKYVDDELSLEERKLVDSHVAGCQECRETLAIFLRNEGLISDALSSSAFGLEFAHSIVDNLRERTKAPSSTFVKVTRILRKNSIFAVAASLLFLAMGGVIFSLHRDIRNMQREIINYKILNAEIAGRYADYIRLVISNRQKDTEEYKKEISNAIAREKDLISARFGDVIIVRGIFPEEEKFIYYDLYRKETLEQENFALKLNKEPLSTPFFRDETAKPGRRYVYKFVGVKEDNTRFESMPIYVDVTGVDSTNWSEIRYLDTPNKDTAVFSISKELNGVRFEEIFTVKVGEGLGREMLSVQAGKAINFSTLLTLVGVEEGDEIITVPIVTPVIDEKNGGVVLNPKTGEPLTKVIPRSFGRRNKKAILQDKDGKLAFIWQGESVRIPAK